jgi:ethylmalonyl-CoA mutase
VLSGSHLELVPEVMRCLAAVGVDAPVIIGGIIPEADRGVLMALGVAAVYTPKDFDVTRIMEEISALADYR